MKRRNLSGYTAVTTTIYLEVDGEEIEFEVTSNVCPGNAGRCYGPVEKCYPPEPPEVDHESIRAGDVLLTAEEFERLAKEAGSKVCLDESAMLAYGEWVEDARAEEADRAYDSWKDRRDELREG